MRRKKKVQYFLGVLLAAFLLIPSGLTIKAEDLQEPPVTEDPPAAAMEEVLGEEALQQEEIVEAAPGEEIPPENPAEETVALPSEEAPVVEKPTEPPVLEEPAPPAEQDELEEPEVIEKTMVPVETFDPAHYGGDPKDLTFLQYMAWLKLFFHGYSFQWENCWKMPVGFLPDIEKLLGLDWEELLSENLKTLTIQKSWYDGDNPLRPHYVAVRLLANGEAIGCFPVLPAMDNKLTLYLPKTDKEGKTITYTVEEDVPHGYLGSILTVEGGFHILNQKAMLLHVMKSWEEDWEEIRPESITYKVMARDVQYGEKRTLTEEAGWMEEFLVPQYDAEGEIHYTVLEDPLEGYVTTYEDQEEMAPAPEEKHSEDCEHYKTQMIHLVNRFTNEKEITLRKIWVDETEEMRPETLVLTLYQNGEFYMEVPVEEGSWEKKLIAPIYDMSMELPEKFLYEVTEEEVPEGYEASVEGYTVTNTWVGIREHVTIEGEKTWLDNGEDRPQSITVHLMHGEEVVATKVVEEVEGLWRYSFKALKYDEEENLIDYTIKEEPVPGYESLPAEGYNLINRRAEISEISGEKTWDDLRGRPQSITVMLYLGEEKLQEKTVKPNEEGKWLYSFENLPLFDEQGLPYDYSVAEAYLMGYDVVYTEYDIKNIQQRATLRILKVDEEDEPLAGAVFEVRDLQGAVLTTLTTKQDGTAEVVLPLGMYRVVELKAPEGYVKTNVNRLVILFNKNQVVTTEIVNQFEEIEDVDPLPLPEDEDNLPQTGESSSSLFYILGLFSLMVGTGTMRRKEQR